MVESLLFSATFSERTSAGATVDDNTVAGTAVDITSMERKAAGLAPVTSPGYGTKDVGYLKITECNGWSLDEMDNGETPVCTTVLVIGINDGEP